MELHLIRHGQTNWNHERRAQGQSDSILTELGISQAQDLGQRIISHEYDAIFCSSSLRTRQTAEHAFGNRPEVLANITYLDSLREIFLGPWEGILYDEIEKSQPDCYRHFWHEPHLFAVAGAESFLDLQSRAITQIHEIAKTNHGKKVAIISHGALIKSVICHALSKPIEELWAPPSVHNCAHSVIEFSSDLTPTVTLLADKPFA
jgi:probable phosphoglycerate mutase